MDLYWPLPLIPESALPVSPVLKEVMWRFDSSKLIQFDHANHYWQSIITNIPLYLPNKEQNTTKVEIHIGLLTGESSLYY